MCGIAGEVRFDGNQASEKTIRSMLDDLKSRGPDGQGMFSQNQTVFGHCRLKIIDLSEASSQPFRDDELGLVIVYNGAVYNYPELREELLTMGYTFKSDGDTEVILKAFHAWGQDCVKRFQGMFAFAIYDRKQDQVFAARDRLGIKPFYYHLDGKKFRFSSFLPSLLKVSEVKPTINPEALNHYLSFRTIVGEETIFNEFRKLPAAHTLTISTDGSVQKKQYWEINFSSTDEDKK